MKNRMLLRIVTGALEVNKSPIEASWVQLWTINYGNAYTQMYVIYFWSKVVPSENQRKKLNKVFNISLLKKLYNSLLTEKFS